jgi:ABC-type phosphate/phosphonate transport system substrate-binding protein
LEKIRPSLEVYLVSIIDYQEWWLHLLNVSFLLRTDSGSHLNSIQMVASRKADVASVDSNVLGYAMTKTPSLAKDLHVFSSIGPLPPYPIMVRSSLPAEEKKAICDALLQLEGVAPWNKRCADLRLLRFVKTNKDIYLEDRESRDALANLSASVRYY